ncbi:helix-turn-helix domain-containing protein [Phototrophicus methaneseepsis]|uniref:Helix-turn-helix domain-containing protein n=1 Tax=Phototrophicus methaneseepsis TaxID=2710758 RepID=A0A7S8E6L4_9CHLR|nr:NB-ARC domain-containing protein [Phototrophicus methaneseepsis]QPC81324.1 helix-turn-helix domain-containing protein [Phototrophicus methaneseepsis]
MNQFPYRDQDYAFGQMMLTLRMAIGLTQAELARKLHVSRRTVGSWEAGSKYPKLENLKQFITLAVENRAFTGDSQVDEIRTLWKASQQKVLFDEAWLTALLSHMQTQHLTATQPASDTRLPERPMVDWGDALSVPSFYGRKRELALLKEWVIAERCQVISILGLGGIGKSALAIKLMHEVAEDFDIVIWRSMRDLLYCERLSMDLVQIFTPHLPSSAHETFEQRLAIIAETFRNKRVLLVIDNLETALQEGENVGYVRPGYEGLERFLRHISQTTHQSCVLLTSREKSAVLAAQEGRQSPVRTLRLSHLESEACNQLLAERDVVGSNQERIQLVKAYAGNPLALKIVAQTIVDLFGGEIGQFLEHGEVIFGGIRKLLHEQFVRISHLEQTVLLWLAIMREPATLDELLSLVATPLSRSRLLEALESLHARSLIERGHRQSSFTLQSVVLEYATTQLIAEATQELQSGQFNRLLQHGLEVAQAREYIRQTQERLIIMPILAELSSRHLQNADVENILLDLLDQLRVRPPKEQGYAPANIITMLNLLRGNLNNLDLSHLALRNMHLQNVQIQDSSLVKAIIQDTIFTETFDALTGLAVSPDGIYWAASCTRGEIRLWSASGLTLNRVWQAHSDMIWALVFSPDGSTLLSGSWDGMLKLWNVADDRMIWGARHGSYINSVAFSPDGQSVASSGTDAAVRLWDVANGTEYDVLPHPAPVTSVVWSPDQRHIATGDIDGVLRLWEVHTEESVICVQALSAHTNWIDGLAFSPDSQTLASASWDGTVKLWTMPDAQLKQTLQGHSDQVSRVAWSTDGRLLASSSRDTSIRIWDAEQENYRAMLRGHTASAKGLVFTPDNRLLSGSEDGTLRVWDISNGACVRTIYGYTASLYDVDWDPGSTQLVSGSTDALVTIYDTTEASSPLALAGHIGVVLSSVWSPDGRYLATSEWNNIIRLWDARTGNCLHVLHHPDTESNFIYGLAWSPDSKYLACGTNQRGALLWDVTNGQLLREEQNFPTWIRPVAWHPDGTFIAGGGDNGIVYIWNASNDRVLHKLEGHSSMITSIAYSPDGTLLASGSSSQNGGELFIWDTKSGQLQDTFIEESGIVCAVAWGIDANQIITGGGDGKLRWWDIQTATHHLLQGDHQGTVQALRRSPDGKKLASAGDDGKIMLWDLQTSQYIKSLRRDRPYERLDITGIQGLNKVQKATLATLGAVQTL